MPNLIRRAWASMKPDLLPTLWLALIITACLAPAVHFIASQGGDCIKERQRCDCYAHREYREKAEGHSEISLNCLNVHDKTDISHQEQKRSDGSDTQFSYLPAHQEIQVAVFPGDLYQPDVTGRVRGKE